MEAGDPEGKPPPIPPPREARRVTVAGNPGHDMAPGTVASILRQAGLQKEDR